MFKKDLLKGKRILVTGGGTGLGKEMATHYGQHGADLYICGRRENVLKDTATEIEDKYNVKVNYETLDIRASSDVESYIDGIFQHLLHGRKSVCQLQIASGIMGNRNSILTEKFKIRLFKMDGMGSQSG